MWVGCPPLSGLTHLSRQPPYHLPLWLPPSLPHKVTVGEEMLSPPPLLSCHDQEPWTAFSLSFPLRELRPQGRAQERESKLGSRWRVEEQSSFLYEAGQTVPSSSSVSSGALTLSTPSLSHRQPAWPPVMGLADTIDLALRISLKLVPGVQ